MKYFIKFSDINEHGLNNIYNLFKNIEKFDQCGGDNEFTTVKYDDDDTPIEVLNPSVDNDSEIEELCKDYEKIPHILPAQKRIICIGDLHGDFDLTIKCLKLAKLIDNKKPIPNWIADPPETVVVQIGDQIDKCRPSINEPCDDPNTTPGDESSDIKILEFFTKLNVEAAKKGGAVISLLGNHEIMNVSGNMGYVSYKGLKQFEKEKKPETNKIFKDGLEARKYFFKQGNKYAKFMACTRQTALIVGSNLFVHATILPQLAKQFNVTDLNILVRKWLLNLIDDNVKVNGIANIGDILYNYNLSPFWPRILGNLPPNVPISDDVCVDNLMETLDLYSVNNMIVGHTPQIFTKDKSGINVTCRDEVEGVNRGIWRIDVGSSSGFDNFKNEQTKELSKPQVLEIIDDNEFNVLS